jgi:polar amino acid transport system substrate-binding protein
MEKVQHDSHRPKHGFWLCLWMCIGIAACQNGQPVSEDKKMATSLPASAESGKVLRYAVFPAPPYMIGAGDPQEVMSGIDVDIVAEIARRLDLKVEYIKCTWERCLELMKKGEADILSSVYKKPEREEYMYYMEKAYLDRLPIAFYTLKKNNYPIKTYEDIYHLEKVGVLQGASYFERFDNDDQVKKFEVPSQDQLFPMLLAGRLDAIAGYIPTENYHIFVEGYSGKISRSDFISQEQVFVYLTLSKTSPFASHLDEMNSVYSKILEEGFITQVVTTYYDRYR